MIRFANVSKRYPNGFEALHDVSLEIRQGEMMFVTGHSGAGKSTLLKLIALLERPSSGTVSVAGVNLGRLRRRRIGMIFQDYRLLHDRTVFDNVALPLVIAGLPHREVGRRVRAALDKVGLLSRERASPVTLSGGEQQRVGIARAVVSRPPILIADEPTGNLDPRLSEEIMRLFIDFNRVGMTLIIASHDLELIRRLGHRAVALESGRIIGDSRGGSI